MTGFGRGAATHEGMQVTVELSSVNRRNLELQFSMPKEWQALERDLAEDIRAAMRRGKVYVAVQTEHTSGATALAWDDRAADATLERLRALAERTGAAWPPSSDSLLKVALLHRIEANLPDAEDATDTVRSALKLALEAMNLMRDQEGLALKADLLDRLGLLQQLVSAIRSDSGDTVARYREVLFNRLRQAGLEIDLDDERVLKEISIFADRCDISEELTRLESHFQQFHQTIDELADNDAIGRRLEFIVQEINREFNTVGSKANNVEVSKHVIEAKNELERIREQIQNVE